MSPDKSFKRGINIMKTNQSMPPLSVVLSNRAKWLWEFAKLRNFSFETNEQRNQFLYIYYLTVKQAFDNNSFAKSLTDKRNRRFTKPLPSHELNKKMNVWDLPENNCIFKNETIIEMLGITEQEVETLQIGQNMKEKVERAKRKAAKRERNTEILLLSAKGWTQKSIAAHLDTSTSTVKRTLRESREFLIKGSDFTINRINTVKDAPTKEFVSPDAERLYSLYKTEKENALYIDEHSLTMAKLQNSDSNIFIQGSAGSGKSTLLKKYLDSLSADKRSKVLLTAPTGKAADIIGGITIHKAFELSNSVQMLDEEITCIPEMLHNISTIVIDELSMVRVDVFTKVMQIIKFAKLQGHNIRIIALGDFAQLRPVVTLVDIEILKMLYPDIKGYYSFHSPLWEDAHFDKIILHNVKRQNDTELVEHLEGIKYGKITDLEWIMKNASPFMPSNPVYICSKRKTVDDFNCSALEEFGKENPLTTYQAEHNSQLTDELPCPERITVGIGVRVLCCCNDKNYKNGMIGTVKSLDNDKIVVAFDNGKFVTIRRKNFILENGTEYKQFPLTLGYAITAHKAQGSTFASVAIVCDGYFEAGQLYCALSRCPNRDSMTFIGDLKPSDLIVNADALKMTVYNN